MLLAHRYAPLHAGLLYLPEFAGVALSAIVFGFVFRTRGLHYQVLPGMIFLSAGIVVIGRVLPPTEAVALIGSGLIGLGIGSSVVPALFIAGYSLPNSNLQRVFAIIELLRAVAAFMIAPLMLHFAFTVGHSLSNGTIIALWICFGISTGGALAGVCLYALGGVRPQAPSLERWFGGLEPGWYSPPLLASIRTSAAPREAPGVAASADEDGDDAAEQTAAEGATLAEEAGFDARSIAVEAAPSWKGIVEAADDHDASVIVLGSHGRTGLASVLIGSVARSRRRALATVRADRASPRVRREREGPGSATARSRPPRYDCPAGGWSIRTRLPEGSRTAQSRVPHG